MIRRRRMTVAMLGAGVLGFSQIAAAQEISQGLSLVGLTLSYEYSDGSSATTLGLGFERLMIGRLSAAGELGYNRESGGSTGEVRVASSYYFLPKSGGSPYASARVGFNFGGDVKPIAYGASIGYLELLGAKQQGAAFKVELAYSHRSYGEHTDMYGFLGGAPIMPTPAFSTNSLALAVGFSFYFRSGH
jgi:hypothetical protein